MKKSLLSLVLVLAMLLCSAAAFADEAYEPVTITLNMQRSGMGDDVEYTITEMPTHVVASGDQFADMLFDLGLEGNMAGYTHGSSWSTVAEFAARETVPQLIEAGAELTDLSKEDLLATGCDFLMAWDSEFSDKNFGVEFCRENGIVTYFPYVCTDAATIESLYMDYETLGKIFKVEDTAAAKIEEMKATVASVREALGDEVYEKPLNVFVYDSGEAAPFTACQGMPGDLLKAAGAVSTFGDIEAGWAKPSWEEVIARDPDAILILDYTGAEDAAAKEEFLKTSPYTCDLRAVKEGRIYSACSNDLQGSANSANTVRILAEQFYPDKF